MADLFSSLLTVMTLYMPEPCRYIGSGASPTLHESSGPLQLELQQEQHLILTDFLTVKDIDFTDY